MTQFVRGALTRARKAGARIIFVTCDPRTELQTFVDLTIAPAVGAEVIAGSTRLKAGTATKLVLNMLTTGAMILIGKTYGNLMVDVQTGSEKLQDRARRIVNIVTGLDYDEADRLLQAAHWNVKAAIVMQKTGLSLRQGAARACARRTTRCARRIGEDIEPRLRAAHRAADRAHPRARRGHHRASPSPAGAAAGTTPAARVVTGPRSSPRTASAFASPVAISTIVARFRIVAIPIDSASRGTPVDIAAEPARRWPRASRSSSVDAMRAGDERVGRLVEADVTVRADAEDQQVDAAGRAMRLRSARIPRRDRCACRREIRCARGAMLTWSNSVAA